MRPEILRLDLADERTREMKGFIFFRVDCWPYCFAPGPSAEPLSRPGRYQLVEDEGTMTFRKLSLGPESEDVTVVMDSETRRRTVQGCE